MHDLHKIITSGEFSFPQHVEGILSSEARDLIMKMLVINPPDRISIPEILSHPWVHNSSLSNHNECETFVDDDDMLTLSRRDMLMGGNGVQEGSPPDINVVNVDNLFPNSP